MSTHTCTIRSYSGGKSPARRRPSSRAIEIFPLDSEHEYDERGDYTIIQSYYKIEPPPKTPLRLVATPHFSAYLPHFDSIKT